MDHSHRPHDGHQRQPQPPEAEQPEKQIEPERTGETHLGGDRQGRQKEGQGDAKEVAERHGSGDDSLLLANPPCLGMLQRLTRQPLRGRQLQTRITGRKHSTMTASIAVVINPRQ